MNFWKTAAPFLLLFSMKTAASGQARVNTGPAAAALDAMAAAIGDLLLGTPRVEFLGMKKSAARSEGDGQSEVITEKTGHDGLASVSYFFEKKTAGQLLYKIEAALASEKLCADALRHELGEPNFPGRPGQWLLSAIKNDPVVSAAWQEGERFVMACNLPGSPLEGDARFALPAGFDPVEHGFGPLFPAELGDEPAEKARFFEILEKQIDAAPANFQKLRGPLMGEAGSGVVECKEPLNLAEQAAISQDDEAHWTLTNYLASGLDEGDGLDYLEELVELLTQNPMKNHRLQPAGKSAEGGFEESVFEILDKKGRLTGLQLLVQRGFYEEEGGWAIDLAIVKK